MNNYEGLFISKEFLDKREPNILKIIEKLKIEINKKKKEEIK